MRLLDLFCGAGGAAMGYSRAGFEVVGVDLHPQPYFPFEFVQADALDVLDGSWPRSFDAIHASPPCQAYSTQGNRWRNGDSTAPALIAEVREGLKRLGKPYVIENVMGARGEMHSPGRICGLALNLGVVRHRLFETNWALFVPPCACDGRPSIGVYGERPDGRRLNSRAVRRIQYAASSLEEAQAAMGMDWADWYGTKEAIPPSYTELIGTQLMQHVKAEVAA